MTEKQMLVLRKHRPDLRCFSDEELSKRYNLFIERSEHVLLAALAECSRGKHISDEAMSILRESLQMEVRIQAYWSWSNNESLETYFADLDRIFAIYEGEVNELDEQEFQGLLDEIEQYAKREDPAQALYCINEGWFEVKRVARQYKSAGLKKPKKLKEMDQVLTNCISYLDTKVKIAPIRVEPFNPRSLKSSDSTCGTSGINSTSKAPTEPKKPSLAQVALICIYKDRLLTDNNADTIAAEYGWKCGDKIMRHYSAYKTREDRIRSGTNNNKKLRDIKAAIDFLLIEGVDCQKAQAELQQLEENIKQDLKNSDRF